MVTIKLKINSPHLGYSIGTEVDVEVNKQKVPLSRFWRRRLADAKTDNCVEVVKKPSKPNLKSKAIESQTGEGK